MNKNQADFPTHSNHIALKTTTKSCSSSVTRHLQQVIRADVREIVLSPPSTHRGCDKPLSTLSPRSRVSQLHRDPALRSAPSQWVVTREWNTDAGGFEAV